MVTSRTLAYTFLDILKKDNAEKQIDELLQYIDDKGLHSLLPRVRYYLAQMLEKRDAFNSLVVISRDKLPAATLKDIKKVANADSKTELVTLIDEQLIGGWQAIYRGSLYDATAASAVRQLHNSLSA